MISTLNKQAILYLIYLKIIYQQWKCHVDLTDYIFRDQNQVHKNCLKK